MPEEKPQRKKSAWNMALSEWSKSHPGKKFGTKGSDSYNEIKAIEAKIKASAEAKPATKTKRVAKPKTTEKTETTETSEVKEKKPRGRKPKAEIPPGDEQLVVGKEVPISHVVPITRILRSKLETKTPL